MVYPVQTVTRPACLTGQKNGRLEPGILKRTPGQAGGPDVELVEPAARAWRALCAEAQKHGIILKISGPGSAYRNYATQEAIFLQRYVPSPIGTKLWDGKRWRKKLGYANAAVPGTSNHGWGLAVDTGEELDGDRGTESISKGTLAWLVANEQRFGFSHEDQTEPWHIRYFAGDRIPLAVQVYENSLRPPHEPPAPAPRLLEDSMDVAFVADTQRYYITNGTKPVNLTKAEAEDLTSPIGGYRMHVFPTDALWRKAHGL